MATLNYLTISGLERETPTYRPTLVDSLPGGIFEVELLWSFISMAIDICLESLIVTLATGGLAHLSPFERAERLLVGAIHGLPKFNEFYEAIALLSVLDHLSGRVLPAVSFCQFRSMAEIVSDPSAFYIYRVLVRYVSRSLT